MADVILSDANSHQIDRASNYTSFGSQFFEPRICYPLSRISEARIRGSNLTSVCVEFELFSACFERVKILLQTKATKVANSRNWFKKAENSFKLEQEFGVQRETNSVLLLRKPTLKPLGQLAYRPQVRDSTSCTSSFSVLFSC